MQIMYILYGRRQGQYKGESGLGSMGCIAVEVVVVEVVVRVGRGRPFRNDKRRVRG